MDYLNKLEKIKLEKGDIYKIFVSSFKDQQVSEIYISEINPGAEKGWKLHEKMTCKLLVIKGIVEFKLMEDGNLKTIIVSETDNLLISIPPKTWFAFKCLDTNISRIMNFADVWHADDPGINSQCPNY